jgi:hypothetical protein
VASAAVTGHGLGVRVGRELSVGRLGRRITVDGPTDLRMDGRVKSDRLAFSQTHSDVRNIFTGRELNVLELASSVDHFQLSFLS